MNVEPDGEANIASPPPPNIESPAPRPACSRTTRIRNRQAAIWTAIRNVYMRGLLYQFASAPRARERREPGQDLAFQELQARAAAGRAVRHLVAELGRGQDRQAVAAAHDRLGALGRGLGHGLGHREAALRERLHLEDAHGAVPEDGLGLHDLLGEELDGAGPDVDADQA